MLKLNGLWQTERKRERDRERERETERERESERERKREHAKHSHLPHIRYTQLCLSLALRWGDDPGQVSSIKTQWKTEQNHMRWSDGGERQGWL